MRPSLEALMHSGFTQRQRRIHGFRNSRTNVPSASAVNQVDRNGLHFTAQVYMNADDQFCCAKAVCAAQLVIRMHMYASPNTTVHSSLMVHSRRYIPPPKHSTMSGSSPIICSAPGCCAVLDHTMCQQTPPPTPGGLVSILASITASSLRICGMFRKSVAFLCICGACLLALLRWMACSSLLAEMPPPTPGGLVSIPGSITANSLRICGMFRKSVAFLCICGACLGALLRWLASSSLLAEIPPPTPRGLVSMQKCHRLVSMQKCHRLVSMQKFHRPED
jgi:hypothetical protein